MLATKQLPFLCVFFPCVIMARQSLFLLGPLLLVINLGMRQYLDSILAVNVASSAPHSSGCYDVSRSHSSQ